MASQKEEAEMTADSEEHTDDETDNYLKGPRLHVLTLAYCVPIYL